jgi:hypothetical protein
MVLATEAAQDSALRNRGQIVRRELPNAAHTGLILLNIVENERVGFDVGSRYRVMTAPRNPAQPVARAVLRKPSGFRNPGDT